MFLVKQFVYYKTDWKGVKYMTLISNQELRERIRTTIPKRTPYNVEKKKKLENIENFNKLSREGLESGKLERRVLLYRTQCDERVYIQYPGRESKRSESKEEVEMFFHWMHVQLYRNPMVKFYLI